MGNTPVSLHDFLKEQHLTRNESDFTRLQARERLRKSQLLQTMQDVCAAINRETGRVIVEEHHYLPPEPVVSSFTFVKGETEYLMRLELWGTSPALVFISRKWRDFSTKIDFFRWIYRITELEPVTMSVRFSCQLEKEEVSEQEVQRWFVYLLSGLRRSYIPSL
jgi:hypothetical protein